jgi:hypothetical protein
MGQSKKLRWYRRTSRYSMLLGSMTVIASALS